MNKNYLPSKIFVIRITVILVMIGLIFGVYKTISYFRNRSANKTPIKILLKDALQPKDSNDNGIADWEEYLWGLNPEKNGESNREYIMKKKSILATNDTSYLYSNNEQTKENETLSKEYFSVIMSLLQSGNLTEESVAEISKAIGKKIEITPIPDTYTKEMLNIDKSSTAQTKYLQAFDKLLKKYEDSDIGNELVIFAQGISGNDPQALKAAGTIASSYRSFGEELMKIPTPEHLTYYHLNLANDYEKTAISIEGLSQMLDNQLMGMKSILNYKKYTEALNTDLDNIYSNLE